jgi:hypothetical protein
MSPEPQYCAEVCVDCQHAALVPDSDDCEASACASCGGATLRVPGANFVHKDLALFAELERIVQNAELSRSEATLIAAELEGVALRWEPPDMVIRHISPRLEGLKAVYDRRQEHSRLLLVVGMLLTIVCARMSGAATPCNRTSRPSGIRRVVVHGHTTEHVLFRPSKSG